MCEALENKTMRIPPEEKKRREYVSRPFKNREEVEKYVKKILDLMDKEEYQESYHKAQLFYPKLEIAIMDKIIEQTQNSKKQEEVQKTKPC